MGKKLVRTEEDIKNSMTLPSENDILGIVTKILGNNRVIVSCQDGLKRMCRIRGKMRRRRWVRRDDIVLVSPRSSKTTGGATYSSGTPGTRRDG